MDDLMKKGLLLSAGLGIIAEEEIRKYLKGMEKRGLIDMGEAERMVRSIRAEKDKQAEKLMAEVEKMVGDALKSAGVVNKKDYIKLEKKIGGLNLKIKAIKKKPAKKSGKKK